MAKAIKNNNTNQVRKMMVHQGDKIAARRPDADIHRAIEIACKRHSFRALEIIVAALEDPTIDFRWKLSAAKEIMDRGFGRPKQTVDQNVRVEGSESLIEALQRARKQVESEVAPTPQVIANDVTTALLEPLKPTVTH